MSLRTNYYFTLTFLLFFNEEGTIFLPTKPFFKRIIGERYCGNILANLGEIVTKKLIWTD